MNESLIKSLMGLLIIRKLHWWNFQGRRGWVWACRLQVAATLNLKQSIHTLLTDVLVATGLAKTPPWKGEPWSEKFQQFRIYHVPVQHITSTAQLGLWRLPWLTHVYVWLWHSLWIFHILQTQRFSWISETTKTKSKSWMSASLPIYFSGKQLALSCFQLVKQEH